MAPYCVICCTMQPWGQMQQLLPCLHYFCKQCLLCYQQETNSKVCPQIHCYSPITVPPDFRYNTCENDICDRRMSPAGDIYRLGVCQHELCTQCYDVSCRKKNPSCPVLGCGQPINEDEERDVCEGGCKQLKTNDELQTTVCCQARLCKNCFETLTKNNKCRGSKCISKDSKKKKKKKGDSDPKLNNCLGSPECEGEVLRNFPSESECEHEMCLECLGKMIEECEAGGKNSPPCCPNENCRINYRLESVLALRALFPDKSIYFSSFDLDYQQNLEALKDDSVTYMSVNPNFVAEKQRLDIKVMFSEDDESAQVLEFDRTGTLGDLLREVRRVLRIMPTDKVYGYMIRQGDTGDDESLSISQAVNKKSLDEMGIKKDSVLSVDINGLVNSKRQDKHSKRQVGQIGAKTK